MVTKDTFLLGARKHIDHSRSTPQGEPLSKAQQEHQEANGGIEFGPLANPLHLVRLNTCAMNTSFENGNND